MVALYTMSRVTLLTLRILLMTPSSISTTTLRACVHGVREGGGEVDKATHWQPSWFMHARAKARMLRTATHLEALYLVST